MGEVVGKGQPLLTELRWRSGGGQRGGEASPGRIQKRGRLVKRVVGKDATGFTPFSLLFSLSLFRMRVRGHAGCGLGAGFKDKKGAEGSRTPQLGLSFPSSWRKVLALCLQSPLPVCAPKASSFYL